MEVMKIRVENIEKFKILMRRKRSEGLVGLLLSFLPFFSSKQSFRARPPNCH